MIFTGFSPNLTGRDTLTALKFLLLPWQWPFLRKGKNVEKAENALKDYFGVKNAFCFDSGRSALQFGLESLGVKKDEEVLVQGFTCVVVSNAIKWAGAKPVYVDIGDDFNMDPDDLEKKISLKTKAIIIQHTFGYPAKIEEILEIARKYKLKIIEDCAHAFGVKYQEQFLGTFGDIGMFSFGADKSLSCVRGGALITGNVEIAQKIKKIQDSMPLPSVLKAIQHLVHLPFFFIGKRSYDVKIGKALLYFAKKFNLMNKIVYNSEKQGKPVSHYPSLLANSLAEILLDQLSEINKINEHRRKISEFYDRSLKNKQLHCARFGGTYLRYPILVNNPIAIAGKAKKNGIILGDWYRPVIAPKDTDPTCTDYKKGSCPKAEELSAKVVNLPTNRHVSLNDAKKIIQILK